MLVGLLAAGWVRNTREPRADFKRQLRARADDKILDEEGARGILERATSSNIPRASSSCSFLEPLPALTAYIGHPIRKGKFLNATEEMLASDARLCVAGARLLDIGAGAGEYTRWLSARCGLCARAYDVVNSSNKFSLLQGRSAKMRSTVMPLMTDV